MGKEKNSKPRIKWLDVSRGFCFLAVIYNHLEYTNMEVMKYFTPFFLTVFFFVSGFLFKPNKKFGEVFEQRTRTLYIPFLFWGLILLFSKYLFSTKSSVTPIGTALCEFLGQYGENTFIWFIPSLYVFSIAFYWVVRCSKSQWGLLMFSSAIMLINWVVVAYLNVGPLPYRIDTAGFAIFWMALGYISARMADSFHRLFSWKIVLCALPVYILIIHLSGHVYNFADNTPYFFDWIAVAILGSYIVIYLSMTLLRNSRLFTFIGANTLLYFILHGKVYAITESILRTALPSDFVSNAFVFNALGVAETLFVVAVLIVPIALINRFLPFTIGKGYVLWKS